MGKETSWNHLEKLSFSSTLSFSCGTEIVNLFFSKKSGANSEQGIVLFGNSLCSSHLILFKRHCTLPGFMKYSIVASFSFPVLFTASNLAPALGPLNLKPFTKTEYATTALNVAERAVIAANKIFPLVENKSNLNLRGLISNLCLQTKFYSYPRRPLFLGALGKARALLAPRACLKTMLLQAFTSRFIAWSQYLCIAKFSSHLFRTRSGRIGQRRCFLFSKKNARSLIEVANCLGLLINNAFIAQCREGSHRKSSHFKTGKAPYCDTRSTRLSFILFLNLFRKLHNNSARFLHDQGSTRRGARLFSRSTRNNCRLDYIGIQKISQGLRGISRHKEIRFILFIRGLISNLSLATKFYSSPRRPPSIVF